MLNGSVSALRFAAALLLNACGKHSPRTMNETWTTTLTNSDGTPASSFQSGINQASNGALTFPGFTFRSVGACGQLTLASASGAAAGQSVLIAVTTGFG